MVRLRALGVAPAGLAALLWCVAAWAAAQPATVADVVALVRRGIVRKQPDGSLARALAKLDPADRVEDRVIEELESLGAGPKTVEALVSLRDRSAVLPLSDPQPSFESPAPPSAAERNQALQGAAAAAAKYLAGLPDFICD